MHYNIKFTGHTLTNILKYYQKTNHLHIKWKKN